MHQYHPVSLELGQVFAFDEEGIVVDDTCIFTVFEHSYPY